MTVESLSNGSWLLGAVRCDEGSALWVWSLRRVGNVLRVLGLRSGAAEAMKQGLSFERWLLRPAGTGAFSLSVAWAASGGGKAGPVMGLRPLLGPPCIPPEAPRWGFPISVILRGLRGFCSGSFLAALGDLPSRRAMPAFAFALDERQGRRIGSRKFQE